MKKIKSVKKVKIKASPVHYVTGVVFIALIGITLYFTLKPKTQVFLLEKGTIEKTSIVSGYVIKQERIIEKDYNKVLLPVIAEGTKTQKGGIVATYKGEEYKNYEENLAKMDSEILELMNYLPVIYSSEVDTIDNEIYKLVKQIGGETSYAKMQEYKQRINTFINKRANIIGELSPDGADIKELIKRRNEYEESAKKSNDNILAPIAGIVSYKTDGLETKLSTNNIHDLSYDKIKQIVDDSNLINNTSIKVVNNYEAYIVAKVPLEVEQYLNQNHYYNIRLVENNNNKIKGELTNINKQDDGIEVYFKITNGVEYLVDLRTIAVEIIWWNSTGLVVNNEALYKYENKDIYYLNVIKYSKLVDIPVNIVKQNDKYSIVDNYDNETLESLAIKNNYIIKLHDRVFVKK